MYDVHNLPFSMQRLREGVNWSRKKQEPFRGHRLHALREMVGAHYSDDGAENVVPLNYIEMGKTVYERHLAANSPRVLCATKHPDLRVAADDWREVINNQLEDLHIGKLGHKLVGDALLGLGLCRVDWAYSQHVQLGDQTIPVGEILVERIGHDDWIHDMKAKELKSAKYMGHRYTRPLSEARSDESYDPKLRAELKASVRDAYNEQGDEKADTLSRSQTAGTNGYDDIWDEVELWDIYIPRYNIIVTLPNFGESDDTLMDTPPLKVRPFTGPRKLEWQIGGPYFGMWFHEVPDNSMPLPPVSAWIDLHELQNGLFRKLGRQAERQKSTLAFEAGAEDDARKIVDTADGQTVEVSNIDKIKEISFGGPDAANHAFVLANAEQVNRFYGPMDLLNGSSPQSDTATQDQLLQDNASARLGAMRDRVYESMRDIISAISYWTYADPLREYRFTKSIEGMSFIQVQDVSTPEQRQLVEYADLNIDLVPYSMQPRGPSERLNVVRSTVQELVGPLMPYLEQQGVQIDLLELMRLVAEYTDVPELMQVVAFSEAPDASVRGAPIGGMPASPFSRRVEERRSIPASTQRGRESLIAGALQGAAMNQGQMAGAARG